jgi:hypothetical protein
MQVKKGLFLIVIIGVMTSCMSLVLPDSSLKIGQVPKKFPEVEVITMNGEIIVGKLAGFETRDTVFLLPAPYWGVEKRSLPVYNIKLLRNLSRRSKITSYVWGGAAITAIAHGVNVLESAHYKEDYNTALVPLAGLSGALCGLLAGLGADSLNPKQFDFASFDTEKRIAVLKHLMDI